jgi:hypothetical protein
MAGTSPAMTRFAQKPRMKKSSKGRYSQRSYDAVDFPRVTASQRSITLF